jgi:hypothetical protein
MDLLQEIGSLRGLMEAHPLTESFGVKYETLRALCDAAEAHLQPDLFAVPHQKKSATSAEAARRWRPKARSCGMMVLRAVWRNSHAGATREQICAFTGVLNQTAAGRLNVLKRAGLIKVEGKRKAKKTGFQQEVYFITQKGRDFLALEAA